MIPRRIYDQPISNGANGADGTWLRAINDWEHDCDEVPAMAATPFPAEPADRDSTPATVAIHRCDAREDDPIVVAA